MNKKVFTNFMIFVFIFIFSFSAIKLIYIYNEYRSADSEYDQLSDLTIDSVQQQPTKAPNVNNPNNIVPEENNSDSLDFDELASINSDFIGWISIPNTGISYPVTHTYNNSYYLDHTFYGSANKAGCIFMEKINKPDFSDDISILYGHNLLNGSMFSNLMKYQDENFFNTNDTLYIYTKKNTYKYKVFSAYVTDINDKAYSSVLSKEIIDSIKSKSLHSSDVNVTEKSKLLLLSTCTNREDDERFIVVLKRV